MTHSHFQNIAAILMVATLGCSGAPAEPSNLDAGVVIDASVDASSVVVRGAPFLVEVEDYDRYTPGLDTSFEILSSQAGFNGSGYVEAMRNAATGMLCEARIPSQKCATIEFDFEVNTLITLFLNLRGYTNDGGSNSFSWEIRPRGGAPTPIYKDKDGNPLNVIPLHVFFPDLQIDWQSYTKKDENVTLGVGRYTLVLFVREPGFKLDQLSMTR